MNIRQQISFYYLFFRSTLIISIPIAVAITFVAGLESSGTEMSCLEKFSNLMSVFLRILCTVGFAASLLYKEAVRKNEYYFYFNAGITKIRLFAVSFAFYVLISTIIYSICFAIASNI
ncbi:hypothetical protein M2451_000959 [Dysgonomonas sp. PFB1-18]|nr:hypothetical protein [Dysgonomonas sp. PF1-14]MDH6338149.1 hypothetical protein [Dysgonomonas sp. PF1-16]MDH6379646.1 hypothetical protein [Dysgonomonas sp. PFB1-18]MDH6396976.1 hypothetical protein [Dysgonomonas sp. PF1-23]